MSSKPAKPPIELRVTDGEIRLAIRVQPRASRNQLHLAEDGRVRASITAPPTDGEANAALCVFLARHFGVSRSAVRIVRGGNARTKIIALRGTTVERIQAKLFESDAR